MRVHLVPYPLIVEHCFLVELPRVGGEDDGEMAIVGIVGREVGETEDVAL